MSPKPYAITLESGTSLLNKTGSWRTARPVYVDRLPPCNHACPAGENIQEWLYRAEEGDCEGAWRQILADNPFPATMGRICYHPCETSCNRGQLDQAVSINGVERFLGDQAIQRGWPVPTAPASGKRVMVVGAGPGGLSASYHLARLGHEVTVYEASPKAGGMMRYGIPRYRLPREQLNAEIARIESLGVRIELGARIDDVLKAKRDGSFDAALLALGAQLARRVEIPSDGPLPVLDALSVLRSVELEESVALRGHVVVYGGGNTAFDVARSAVRLGAMKATIVAVEAREHLPAHMEEVQEALAEGAELICSRSVQKIEGSTLTLETLIAGDDRQPRATGQLETLDADVLVQAIGQEVDTGPLDDIPGLQIDGGVLQVGLDMQTSHAGIFAGGDMVPSPRSATHAIGHGKKAARHIDAFLRGESWAAPTKHDLARPEYLNSWYYGDAPRAVRPILEMLRRQSGFAEIVGNFTEEQASYEARRCLSCGNCFECDNCYGVCPDNAVIKLGPGKRFEFNYDYCKGCGLCAEECPCGAIQMDPEEI